MNAKIIKDISFYRHAVAWRGPLGLRIVRGLLSAPLASSTNTRRRRAAAARPARRIVAAGGLEFVALGQGAGGCGGLGVWCGDGVLRADG